MEKKTVGKKAAIWVIAAIIVLAIGGFAGYTAYTNMPAQRLKEQLELGQKYLTELDYEQAVAAFKSILDIDPNYEDARTGLLSAYGAWGKELVKAGKYEDAAEMYDEARSILGDDNDLKDAEIKAVEQWIEACLRVSDFDGARVALARLEVLYPEVAVNYKAKIDRTENEARFKAQVQEWLAKSEFPYTIDGITLGQSHLADAKAAYSGRGDYKSNPMKRNGSEEYLDDSVYSMPYVENNDGVHDAMQFGYLFVEPLSGGTIYSMAASDPGFLCLGGIRPGDSLVSAYEYLGIQVPESIVDFSYDDGQGNRLYISKDHFRFYRDGVRVIIIKKNGLVNGITIAYADE